MTGTLVIPAVVAIVASLVAAATDVARFKVYNKLTVPLLVTGLVYHTWTSGITGLTSSLGGAALGFGLLIFLWCIGAMGAGDVKFVTSIGAWLGAEQLLPVIWVGCLATGVYGIALLILHGGAKAAWINFQLSIYRLMIIGRHISRNDDSETVQETAKNVDERRKRLIPFSAMIGIGVVATIAWQWMH